MAEPSGIEATGLVKTFSSPTGPVEAVRDLDLSIEPGVTAALLGPNGAGKTTTIDMLLGLTKPGSGQVTLFGLPPDEAVAAGYIGAMLQTGALIPDLSVRELVAMIAALYPDPLDVDETIELCGIGGFADRRTQKLSGGETQRARFAVALVSDPRLLVLDEPTVGMDVEARREFWATMREFASRGKTVLFATHYMEEADDFADRAILMARGQIVADGPTSEIKSMVGRKTIRATIPGAGPAALGRLNGVTNAEMHGNTAILSCDDSDAAIRALLEANPGARDIEISVAGLEEAFLELTGPAAEPARR